MTMRTTKEKKFGLFLSKDVYITKDGRKFYDKTEAEEYEWYLINKKQISDKYKITSEFDLSLLNVDYINNPIFKIKFFIENYDSEKEHDISNFLHGLIIDKKIKSDISIKSHIKNNGENGWYLVVLNKHITRGNELHFFSIN